MSFDTRNGTRGARQPKGKLLQWANRLMISSIRRKGGEARGGVNRLVLTTIGRKTGAERQSPLAWFPSDGGGWLVVASAGGAPGNPAWYYNLGAHPDRVSIETGGKSIAVTAEQLHGDEREQAWQQITAASPQFADYQVKTDRELPVIRLTGKGTDQ